MTRQFTLGRDDVFPTAKTAVHELVLKPRAIAALCALRQHAQATTDIRSAIGDEGSATTYDLMNELRDLGLVTRIGPEAITNGARWTLTARGVEWCHASGIPIAPEIERASV